MIQRHMTLSEPEGECSDCSSYEELSSNSEAEREEVSLAGHGRKDSESSYRSWYLRRGSKDVSSHTENPKGCSTSVESLTVIIESQKTWWYWMKLAVFLSTPFIARQLGVFFGKRLLKRLCTTSTMSQL